MRAVINSLVLVGAAALVTACGKAPTEAAAPAAPASANAAPTSAAPPAATPAAATPADSAAQAALAALPAPYDSADIANGQRKFALCRSCHTLTAGGPNMTGPNLNGLFGRAAGTAPKFNYSDAVKNAGFKWDAEHLDKWLADPRGDLPGNRMTFVGLKDPKDRTDVIAYLMIETAKTSAN